MPFYNSDDFDFTCTMSGDDFEKVRYMWSALDLDDWNSRYDLMNLMFHLGLCCLDGLLIDDQGNYNKKLFDFLIEE